MKLDFGLIYSCEHDGNGKSGPLQLSRLEKGLGLYRDGAFRNIIVSGRLWNRDLATEVIPDWGRYLLLKHTNVNVLFYDSKLSKLAVPLYVPLPNILAKSTALCSGLAPIQGKIASTSIRKISANYPINIYSTVPKPIADKIAEKLGCSLILISIKNNIAKCKQ